MNCEGCRRKTKKTYCKRCQRLIDNGWEIGTFRKKLDDTDIRLDKAVRQGKMEGKPLNKLRSHMKNGKWQYKYI